MPTSVWAKAVMSRIKFSAENLNNLPRKEEVKPQEVPRWKVKYPPNEIICNILPKVEVETETTPRYVSRFREQVKQETKQNKLLRRTMGVAEVEKPSPDKFLQKHSKEPKLPEKKPFSYQDVQPRKPQLPAAQPFPGARTLKDFIRDNVEENIMSVARKPEPAYIHTTRGDKELLENSGLVPKYSKKKDFGQTPEYLKQIQEIQRIAREEYEKYVKKKMEEGAMLQISEGQRQQILQGLKTNYNELYHQYQGLSLVTDMISKRRRKQRLEAELLQLEKDIELMEKHTVIYINRN